MALRATVFGPSLIGELVALLDETRVESVWFPSVGKAFDPLDMCGIALGRTRRLRVATGVIKSSDYGVEMLQARVNTLSEGSGRRFILGVGTGAGIGGPAVQKLVTLTSTLRESYPSRIVPPVFFAALRGKILSVASQHADGALLNFCPPSFVSEIRPKRIRENFTLGCYVKLFFAEEDAVARKMLVDEIRMYDRIPQYHAMFEEIGVSGAIRGLERGSTIPDDLLEISMANPSDVEVVSMLEKFMEAGVGLPIIYPYISGDDVYKTSVVERLGRLG